MSFTTTPKADPSAGRIEYHRHRWGATPEGYICGHVNRDGTSCGAFTAGWSWPTGDGMHVNARLPQAGDQP